MTQLTSRAAASMTASVWCCALACALACVAACGSTTPAAPPATTLEGLTAQLVAAIDAGDDVDRIAELAARRAPLWDAAAAADPDAALRSTLPSALHVPDEVRALVEQPLDRTGAVTSYVTESRTLPASYHLAFGALELYPTAGTLQGHPRSGERLHVTGYAHGDVAIVTAATRGPGAQSHLVAKWGTRKLLAVILDFQDFHATTTAADDAAKIFGAGHTTAGFYSNISNGEIAMTGDVVGPFTIDANAQCSFAKIQEQTYQALAANHIDVADYQSLVALMPSTKTCSGDTVGQSMLGPSLGTLTFAWATETSLYETLIHELGHGAGLLHAHWLFCGEAAADGEVPPGDDVPSDLSICGTIEYGNWLDPMGNGTQVGDFDAFELEYLGWLGHGAFGTAQGVTASGTYALVPQTTYGGTRALEIPFDNEPSSGFARSIYVDYHVAQGNDANLPSALYHTASVALATSGQAEGNLLLKELSIGDTFTAPSGLVIQLVSGDDGGAQVAVTMPPTGACTRTAPRFLVLDGSVPENTFVAGSTDAYTLEIQNADSTGCGPSTFAVSQSGLPASWTFDAPSLTIPAGGFGQVTVYVTSPVTATGDTTFTATVSDTSVAGHSAAQTAEYIVSSCTPVAPTITLSPASGMQVAAGGTATFLYTYRNNNPSGCGSTAAPSIEGAVTQSGWTVPTSSIDAIAPGESKSLALAFVAPATTVSGTYQVAAATYYATLTQGGAERWGQALTTASLTIGPACVHTPPQLTISPASQTSTTGAELDYAVTARDLDGSSCGSSTTIALAVAAPSGFTATLDASSLAVAAGATGTTTLRLTPITPGSTTPASYTATVTATNVDQATSLPATYVLSCGTIVAPHVSIGPSTQRGEPGQTLSYAVTVANKNTSTLCGSRSYTLTSTVTNLDGTTGWTSAVGNPTMTLASGASASTTLTVTSPLDAAAPWAVYEPIVTATDDLGNHASASTFYAIVCTNNPASLTLSPIVSSSAPGADVAMQVTLRNNDTVGCVPTTMTFASRLPGGWTTTTIPDQVTLSPGASTVFAWTPHVASGAPEGTYYPTLSVDSNGLGTTTTAQVDVSCPRVAPTITLTPSSQSGPAALEAAYLVTVASNDPAACSAVTYALGETAPAGWTAELDDVTATPTPGSDTDGTTFRLTAPVTATGTSTFTVTATHGAVTGTATGAFTVTCTTKKPLVSLSPTSQTAAAGSAMSYTATVTNQDSGCAAESIALAAGAPTGWTKAVSPTPVTLAPGAATTATLTVTSPLSATGGNSVSVAATSSKGTTTGAATAVLTAPVCTRAAPQLALTPTSQSAAAGAGLAYTVRVVDEDAAGCASEAFALSASVPATPTGWTSAYSPSSLTLAAGGGSGTSTLTVTSPAAAGVGSDAFTATATGSASGTAAAAGTYVVSSTCARAAPSVALSPSSQSAVAGAALSYTATVTNHDAACGTSTFTVTPVGPTGWTLGVDHSSVSLASGASTAVALTATSVGSASAGTYGVSVTASDAASGSGTGSASDVVAPSCVRAAPTVAVSPPSQSGSAGSSLAYAVTVTDHDASCGTSTFTLAPIAPAGFTVTLAQPTAAIASGDSATIALTAVSAGSAAPATYAVGATASAAASGSGSGTAADVVTASCARAAPTLTVAPSSRTGAPGAAASYTLTLTNHDSGCAAGSYALAATVPPGWSSSFASTPIALASGASADVVWTVTSAVGAAAGDTAIGASATDATSGSATAAATYTVLAACARAAPRVSIAPASQSGVAGSTLGYTATVTNADSACADQTFALAGSGPSGWTATPAMSSVTLASGSATDVALAVTSPAGASGATAVSLTATGATSGAASGSATYVASAGCAPATPTLDLEPATQAAVAGTPLVYSATITNADTGCAAQAFAIAATGPSGWTVAAAPQVMLAAGASTSIDVTVTSPADALGNGAVAVAISGSSGSASAGATYAVTCSRGAPTVAIAPAAVTALAGSAARFDVTVTNTDTGCDDETFALAATSPDGWTSALGDGALSIARGSAAATTWTVTSPAGAPAGDVMLTLTAAGVETGLGSATYTVAVAGAPDAGAGSGSAVDAGSPGSGGSGGSGGGGGSGGSTSSGGGCDAGGGGSGGLTLAFAVGAFAALPRRRRKRRRSHI